MSSPLMKNLMPLIVLPLSAMVSSAPFVYTPTNPSFGGNPMYGSVLLGNASAQNTYTEEREDGSSLDQFNDRLQRSILNRISTQVATGLVDDDGNLLPGTTETNDFIIEVVDGGDSTTITTTDKLTGESTTFTVDNSM